MNIDPKTFYFVDTNILVYAHDRSASDKHSLASQLVAQCWQNGNGCLSIQVLQEFYVCVTRKIPLPLVPQEARQIIAELAHWKLHVPSADDLLQAIDFQISYRLSFWDALLLHSAARLGCKRLFSEDLTHGETYGEVQVVNPFLILD